MLMENVEALASTEAGEETCYSTITTEDAQQVFIVELVLGLRVVLLG